MSYFYLGDKKALYIRKSGLRLLLDLKDLGIVNFISTDIYEPDVSFAIKHLVRPGSIFVDIGANLGIHSLEASRLMNRQGAVVAIEANPRLAALLRDNVSINGYQSSIRVEEFAAWHEQATVEFSTEENAHRVGGVRIENATNYGATSVSVSAKPVDQLCLNPKNISAVKIDVEGREAFVIEGMRKTIEAGDFAIIAEYQPDLIDEVYGIERFHALMKTLNRIPYRIDAANVTLVPSPQMPDGHSNIVWLKTS